MAPYGAATLPAMQGNFACCQLSHELNGVTVACDKGKVAKVLETMLKDKVQYLASLGNRKTQRHFATASSLANQPSRMVVSQYIVK